MKDLLPILVSYFVGETKWWWWFSSSTINCSNKLPDSNRVWFYQALICSWKTSCFRTTSKWNHSYEFVNNCSRVAQCYQGHTMKHDSGLLNLRIETLIECFFYWQFFAKFQPEMYGFNLYKGFFMERMAHIRQILKKKSFQITRFLW